MAENDLQLSERDLATMQNKSVISKHIAVPAGLRTAVETVSGSIGLTCLFGSFAFLQYTVLGLANHAGEGYLTTGQRDFVYYALQVFVILGFLLHAVYARICAKHQKASEIRNGIAYTVFCIFFACAAVLLFVGSGSMFYVIVSMIAVLCIGFIGGAAHYRMSLEAVDGAKVAKSMGVGSAAAVVLQYLFQIRAGVSPALPFFMLAAFLLLVYSLPGRHPEPSAEKIEAPVHTPRKQIVLSILITAMFILFACFYNEYIHHLQIQSNYGAYNVYSWPRLMLVPGYLLYAFIGDRKDGRYVPVATLCIMLIALLNAVLTGNPGMHWVNMCLFYCSLAACTSYYHLTFWRLAPSTGWPALWAPFGRMIDSGMVLITGAIHLSTLSPTAILVIDIVGLALIILMMVAGGSFNFSSQSAQQPSEPSETVNGQNTGASAAETSDPILQEISEMTVSSHILSEEETISRMQDQYNLTPREADVLRELVLSDDIQTVISDRLSIQVRTLQNHVTQIYRKTGVATRAGLTDLYHETRIKG